MDPHFSCSESEFKSTGHSQHSWNRKWTHWREIFKVTFESPLSDEIPPIDPVKWLQSPWVHPAKPPYWLITAILQVHCDRLSIEDRCQLIKWKNENSQQWHPSPGESYGKIPMEISGYIYLRTLSQVWIAIWILTSWFMLWVWLGVN